MLRILDPSKRFPRFSCRPLPRAFCVLWSASFSPRKAALGTSGSQSSRDSVPAETPPQSSCPPFQPALPPSARVCPLQLPSPSESCAQALWARCPTPSRTRLLPAHLRGLERSSSPQATGNVAAPCHPRQDHASFVCAFLGSAPNKALVSLFPVLILCLLESRFVGDRDRDVIYL